MGLNNARFIIPLNRRFVNWQIGDYYHQGYGSARLRRSVRGVRGKPPCPNEKAERTCNSVKGWKSLPEMLLGQDCRPVTVTWNPRYVRKVFFDFHPRPSVEISQLPIWGSWFCLSWCRDSLRWVVWQKNKHEHQTPRRKSTSPIRHFFFFQCGAFHFNVIVKIRHGVIFYVGSPRDSSDRWRVTATFSRESFQKRRTYKNGNGSSEEKIWWQTGWVKFEWSQFLSFKWLNSDSPNSNSGKDIQPFPELRGSAPQKKACALKPEMAISYLYHCRMFSSTKTENACVRLQKGFGIFSTSCIWVLECHACSATESGTSRLHFLRKAIFSFPVIAEQQAYVLRTQNRLVEKSQTLSSEKSKNEL